MVLTNRYVCFKTTTVDINELYAIYLAHPNITTDTRKIEKGSIFFALKGPNFNGNTFAQNALDAGAAYAVIDEPQGENAQFILVENVLETLHALAKKHRESFSIPFIGITGSNGKTTTKELVHAVLSQKFITYYTHGNFNNHIGIPLTILSIKKDAEIAIIEMGANHQKEIEGYCKYVEPSVGIITNCGKAHLEGFGGIEGVRKGKGELYDYIRANGGSVFAFDDYDYFHEMSKGIKDIHWYGTSNGEVQGSIISSDPFLKVSIKNGLSSDMEIDTQLVGDYNLPNVLCAVNVGHFFGVSDDLIAKAIDTYEPSNSRSQLIQSGSNKIILDAYNANPTSMSAAIKNFARIHGAQKVLMIGGMMELGAESIAEHQAIVDLVKSYKWKNVVFVGGDFGKIDTNPHLHFSNAVEAKQWFDYQHFEDTEILIKGSNSMKMGTIIN